MTTRFTLHYKDNEKYFVFQSKIKKPFSPCTLSLTSAFKFADRYLAFAIRKIMSSLRGPLIYLFFSGHKLLL
jgi:hypothetical protein